MKGQEYNDLNNLVQDILRETALNTIVLMIEDGIIEQDDSKRAVQIAKSVATTVKVMSMEDFKDKTSKPVVVRDTSTLTKNDDAYINELIEQHRNKQQKDTPNEN